MKRKITILLTIILTLSLGVTSIYLGLRLNNTSNAPSDSSAAPVNIQCGINIDPVNPGGNPSGSTMSGIHWARLVFKSQQGYGFYDSKIDDYNRNNVRVIMIINHESYWGNGTNDWNKGDFNSYATDYANKAREIASRYGAKVQAYEIWNEPDGQGAGFASLSPQQLSTLVDKATDSIRSVSSAKIVVGGFMQGDGVVVNYLNAMPQSVRNKFDAVAVHPYLKNNSNVGPYLNNILALKNKIWITEFSWRNTGYSDPSAYIRDWYSYLDQNYAGRVEVAILYAWSDAMQADQGEFGIVDTAGNPKAVYNVFFDEACGASVPTLPPDNNQNPTPTGNIVNSCPDINPQFWFGCPGSPTSGCNGLGGWIDGSSIPSNLATGSDIDVNCFANGGAFSNSRTVIRKDGVEVASNNASFINDFLIQGSGTYVAECISTTIANCSKTEQFIIGSGNNVTPVPTSINVTPGTCPPSLNTVFVVDNTVSGSNTVTSRQVPITKIEVAASTNGGVSFNNFSGNLIINGGFSGTFSGTQTSTIPGPYIGGTTYTLEARVGSTLCQTSTLNLTGISPTLTPTTTIIPSATSTVIPTIVNNTPIPTRVVSTISPTTQQIQQNPGQVVVPTVVRPLPDTAIESDSVQKIVLGLALFMIGITIFIIVQSRRSDLGI